MSWEIRIDIYILLCVKQITNGNLMYSTGNLTPMLCGYLNGKETPPKGAYIYIYTHTYIHIADSLCCAVESIAKQLCSNKFF